MGAKELEMNVDQETAQVCAFPFAGCTAAECNLEVRCTEDDATGAHITKYHIVKPYKDGAAWLIILYYIILYHRI